MLKSYKELRNKMIGPKVPLFVVIMMVCLPISATFCVPSIMEGSWIGIVGLTVNLLATAFCTKILFEGAYFKGQYDEIERDIERMNETAKTIQKATEYIPSIDPRYEQQTIYYLDKNDIN